MTNSGSTGTCTILCHLVSQWHVTSRLHFPVPWLESRDPCSGREPSILGVTLHPVGVQDVARHGGTATGGGYGLASKIGPQSQLPLTESGIPKIFVFNHHFQTAFRWLEVSSGLYMFVFGMTVAINKQPFFVRLGPWGIPFRFQRFLF